MTEQQQSAEEVAQAVYAHVGQLMNAGHSDADISADLVSRGFDSHYANAMIGNLNAARLEQKKSRAKKNIGLGAAWFFGGALITAATYSAATGGGTYVVTWGAIVIGAVQMLAGLVQLGRAK